MVEIHPDISDNILPFNGSVSMGTSRTMPAGHGRPAKVGDGQASNHENSITAILRERGWSEDAILASKVVAVMSTLFGCAWIIALVINAADLVPYILN